MDNNGRQLSRPPQPQEHIPRRTTLPPLSSSDYYLTNQDLITIFLLIIQFRHQIRILPGQRWTYPIILPTVFPGMYAHDLALLLQHLLPPLRPTLIHWQNRWLTWLMWSNRITRTRNMYLTGWNKSSCLLWGQSSAKSPPHPVELIAAPWYPLQFKMPWTWNTPSKFPHCYINVSNLERPLSRQWNS